MPLDTRLVEALLRSATDLEGPDRAAFLDRECGQDRELRSQLADLLATRSSRRDEVVDTLVLPKSGADRTASAPIESGPTPLVGAVIAGRYRLGEAIGEGGMGIVYLAEQTQPVRRQVALKLIKPGMDTKTVLARFESERQALAMMDHPGIAKVLDAGTTDQGRPFFVMELVRGVRLTDYCDRHRLGLPDRLALFRQICSAVQHAHQKGIIHRDLKPSNILVESHDDHPVPKVIDFGLAKAVGEARLSEHSLQTTLGSVAGTPLYMAPEQATFNALDIDTRVDIYALGVILYELLTGSTPIRTEAIKSSALDEMLRMIREEEPPTPSSRISTSESLPSLAANRHIEPSRLSRFVRGDLDWIVMKALAKERDRRYPTAVALADDLDRFVRQEPVSAGPPTARYRLGKFLRRHRGRVVAASIVVLALVGGVVGTTLGLIEANRQRALAEKRLAQKDRANEILLNIFANLDPFVGDKKTLPLPERLGNRLDAAAEALDGEAIDDPLGVARMQFALSRSQLNLGHADKAIALLKKARATYLAKLGADDPLTLMCTNDLAVAYRADGHPDLALPMLREVVAAQEAKLGPDHRETLMSKNNLAAVARDAGRFDEALALFRRVLATREAKFGAGDPATVMSKNNLAAAYLDVNRPDLALPLFREVLEAQRAKLGADHPETLSTLGRLAMAHQAAGRADLALPLLEEALALLKTKIGADHPGTLTVRNNLAMAYYAAGRLDLAMPIFEDVLAIEKAKLGADHPDTLRTMNNLAMVCREAGKLDRAILVMEETLRLRAAKSGDDHPDTWMVRANLGQFYKDARRPADARPLLEGATRASRKIPTLRWVASILLDAYNESGDVEKAVPLAGEILAEGRAASLKGPPLGRLLARVGLTRLRARDWGEAESLLTECLAIRRKAEPDTWTTSDTESMLGAALLGRKKYAEAEPLLRSGYEGMSKRADKIPPAARPRLAEALDRLIAFGEATGKADEVQAWKAERAKLDAGARPVAEEK